MSSRKLEATTKKKHGKSPGIAANATTHDIDDSAVDASVRDVIARLASTIMAKENRFDIGLALGLTLVSALLNNYVPHLIASAAEDFSEDNRGSLGVLITAIIGKQLLPIMRDKLLIGISMRSTKRILMDAADALMNKRGLSFHAETQASDKAILFNKSLSVPEVVAPILTKLIPSAIDLGVLTLGISGKYGSRVAMYTAMMSSASVSYSIMSSKKGMDKRTRYLNSGRETNAIFSRAVTNPKSIHDAGRSSDIMRALDEVTNKMSSFGEDSQTFSLSVGQNNIAIIAMFIVVVASYVNLSHSSETSLVNSGQDIIILITYLSLILNLLPTLGEATSRILSSYPNVKDVVGVLLKPSEVLDPYPNIPMQLQGYAAAIEFEGVKFSHQPDGEDLNTDRTLSFSVSPGERVALVGRSGAGKSTVFNLLCRYLNPQRGRITINGIDIASVGLNALRENISVVAQKPSLFKGSVRDNILFSVKDSQGITDEQIYNVAKEVGLEGFLRDLNKGTDAKSGLDAPVGEGGQPLSGGEQQLVAIISGLAGCILGGKRILLLDEFTSALSADLAERVLNGLKNSGLTVLAITHKLAEIKDFDSIVILEDGNVIAQGAHETLIASNGGCDIYRDLYSKQNVMDNANETISPKNPKSNQEVFSIKHSIATKAFGLFKAQPKQNPLELKVRQLKDHTPADPYGPGAIVLYQGGKKI